MKEYMFVTWTPDGLNGRIVRNIEYLDYVAKLFNSGNLTSALAIYDKEIPWVIPVINRFGQEVCIVRVD